MTNDIDPEQTAAAYLMRKQEPDWSDVQQRELDLWLEQSMAHKAAFWRLQDGLARIDRHMMSALGGDNQDRMRKFSLPSVYAVARPMRATLLAMSCAALFAGGYWALKVPEKRQEYTRHITQFGQIGKLVLADGSQVELNTDSDVRITQLPGERALWLERGEAYFEVAEDKRRPFIVRAGSRSITVLGTKFDVRRDGDDITVSVLEGRVSVAPGPGWGGGYTTLTAGEIASTDGLSILVTAGRLAQIQKNLAWRFSMLAFDNISLREAAVQFNRYNVRQLVVHPDAANLRISGSFRIGNVEGFATLLQNAYGLKILRSDKKIELHIS